jgi:predicted transcriptional regulator
VKKIVAMKRLTKKEEVIMNHFWDRGPLFVRELRELYPEPRPHFSTLSTQVRTLQDEGFIGHKSYGPTYQYFAKVTREEYNSRSLTGLIDKYFDNSYINAVSALVREEKITVEELKELIDLIEKGK